MLSRSPVVDAHVHHLPPALTRMAGGPSVRVEGGVRYAEVGGRKARIGPHDITSLVDAVETAGDRGIDHVLVSPWVQLLGEAFESETRALEMCRVQNRELAALAGPVSALGTVPMRSPALAASELRRAVALGLAGVEVTASVNGAFLGEDAFDPFWKAAEELRALVFIHPTSGGPQSPGAGDYFLWNTVGNPVETATTAAHMVMAGVMERHPELRVVLAHGGGAVLQLRGRLDRAWSYQREARSRLGEPPSASLRRFHVDSCVYDATLLRQLVEFAGAERVLLGTDHPFEMAEPDPVGLVRSAALGEEAEQAVLGGNAARLLGFHA